MKRPLVFLTVAFCLGIFVGNRIKINFTSLYLFTLALFILTVSLFNKRQFFNLLLFSLAFTLGAAILENTRIPPRCHIRRVLYYKSTRPYNVRGYVACELFIKNNRTAFIFKTQEAQLDNLKFHCCGNILVFLKGQEKISYGEELILRGRLYRPFNFSGNKKQNYRDYLSSQGIYLLMNAQTTRKLNKNSGLVLRRLALGLKKKMKAIIFQYVHDPAARILDAMILGERKDIPAVINSSMVKSGTVHILVVSGFHVGIVVFLTIFILKLLRLSRSLRLSLAIICLIIYCFITGASTPVVRATVMGIVFLFALMLKREPDIYNSLALACLFILLVNPRQLFAVGFQLSFVSVISIVYLYPKLKAFFRLELFKIKSLKVIFEVCLVSFSAWVGTMGFITYYFKIFSPITVIANIFIVPLAILITLCGFSLILIGLIFPPLAFCLASTCEFLVALLLGINAFLIKIPGAYFYLP